MRATEAWEPFLTALTTTPRENGTVAVNETALWIAEALRGMGITPDVLTYSAHPYRLRIAGCLVLLGAIIYAWLLASRRPGFALLTAIVLPAVMLADLDYYVPIFGWIGATPQHHVEAWIGPADPQQQLWLVAHFDSKTDLLDHVERAPLELLAVPATLMMWVGAWITLRRGESSAWSRAAIVAAVTYGIALFVSISSGALVGTRSTGALDDGAACAVLLRLADRLQAKPPEHTKVRLLWVSGEEAGVYGSWIYAREYLGGATDLPSSAINLEFLGAAADLAVFGRETFTLRSYRPDAKLLATLDGVHQEQRGKPLHRTWYGAATDARSFLAHGVPALTLLGDLPEHAFARDMHSVGDHPGRIDMGALDANLEFLESAVRALDQGP